MIKQIQLAIMDRGPYANLIQPGVQIGYRANVDGVVYNPVYQLHLGQAGQEVAEARSMRDYILRRLVLVPPLLLGVTLVDVRAVPFGAS